MKREVSIAFQTDKSPQHYIALAKLVDRYAFGAVTVYCDMPYHPSFSPLMLMAPHITRARLGVAAVSPSRMAPIDMAANIALLAQVATSLGVSWGCVMGAVTVIDEDRKLARQYTKLDQTLPVEPELIDRLKQHVEQHDFESAAS